MGASTEKDEGQSATSSRKELLDYIELQRDLHASVLLSYDQATALISALSETAPLVAGDLAKQREIHDTYAPVSAIQQNDDAPRLDWIFGVLNTEEIVRRVQAVSDVYACGSIHGIRLGDVRHAIDVAKQQYVEGK